MTAIQKLQKIAEITAQYSNAARCKKRNLTLAGIVSECKKYNVHPTELVEIYTKQYARTELQQAGLIA